MGNYFYITPEDYRIAEGNGLSRKDVYRRVYEENWSIKRAITTPKRKIKPMTKYTEKQKSIIKENGLTTRIVSQRICRGWDIERAINIPFVKPKEKASGRGRYKYSDEIINIVLSNGIKLDTFYRRVRDGWSISDASTIPTGTKKINNDEHIWRKLNHLSYEEWREKNDRGNVL